MISRDVIDAIRERTDIAAVIGQVVTLRRKGSSLMGLCPFHQEKSPSFSVVPAKGIFHCFGCGEGGDVFTFLMKTRGLSFFEAAKELGEACGVAVEDREQTPEERRRLAARRDLYDVCALAGQWFQANLLVRPEGKVARDYLAGRGMDAAVVERFKLGFAPEAWSGLLDHLHGEGVSPKMAVSAGLARWRAENDPQRGAYDLFRGRVIVPIEDNQGRIVAFGGRVLPGAPDDAPKYVNSPETDIYKKSKTLYALSHARSAIQRKDRVLLVEGYFDVLSLHQYGFEEAVATCGTALTSEHMEAIRRLTKKAVALFDADEAGLRAAVRSMELFLGAGVEPLRLDLGDAKDPDEFLQTHGTEAFDGVLDRSQPLVELVLMRSMKRHGATPGGKQRVVDEMAPLLRQLPSGSAERLEVVHRIARALGLSEGVVEDRVGRGAPTGRSGDATRPTRWLGDPLLNRLLWLLVHFPEQVGPVVAEVADPHTISRRESVLQAVALLLGGEDLSSVIDAVDDPDLGRVLRVAAAKEGLHDADGAAAAARQILVLIELGDINRALSDIDVELSTCATSGDRSSSPSVYQRRAELQKRKDAIKREFPRLGR